MKKKNILAQISVSTSISSCSSVSATPSTSPLQKVPTSENTLPPEVIHWVTVDRNLFLFLIQSWGFEFSRQDAEDILEELLERLLEKGYRKILGKVTKANFICNLRREKENFRRRRATIKRGGAVPHQSVDDLGDWQSPANDASESETNLVLLREELLELQRHLGLIRIQAKGELLIFLEVLERIFHRYEGPASLYEAMDDREKEAFLPEGVTLDHEDSRKKILSQISRTLTELRRILRKIQRFIELN